MTQNFLIGSAAEAVVQWAASSASRTRVTSCKEFKGPGGTESCNLRNLEESLMMKLSLTKVVNGCRLGKIQNLGKAGDCTVDIPGCLLYTRTGSAPHLTHHTLHNIHGVPAMAQLTLSTLAEHQEVLAEYKKGVGSFIGMPESLFYCSLHDPVSPGPAGYVTNKSVSVWGFGGRVEMTVSKFMAIQEALQPDWFQCLSDGEASCAEATSIKRARKSVDRSLLFLDSCLRLQEESESKPIMKRYELMETKLWNPTITETRLHLLSSVTAELPEDKPRPVLD
ncbi:queuine tRNA-ribosyltransferase subunit QTRTD1 [Cricetulus griseus]|nr:queuine tRNA-ribosyltransferase subunit QTRTD1 [Cricetulus griseus]